MSEESKETKKILAERDWSGSDEFETLAYICQENSGLKARILDRLRGALENSDQAKGAGNKGDNK